MRAVAWNTATAADRGQFQAPFRAGIRLDPYQLLPLSKALKLPRVNLMKPGTANSAPGAIAVYRTGSGPDG
jgi:hypothetical protein